MKTRFIFLLITCGILVTIGSITKDVSGKDIDNDGVEDDVEQSLAEEYAPVLYFHEDEKFFPVGINYHLNNSNLNQSVQGEDAVLNPNPNSTSIGNRTDPDARFYLDNRKGTVDDNGIEKDYRKKLGTFGYTVYSRVTGISTAGVNYTIVQYWMFYAFNEGPLNTHEGDWEMAQFVLNSSKTPVKAMYSQHTGGQKATWSDVETDGGHPSVFIAKGSHANYFRSYQGKFSLAKDSVGDNGKTLKPKDYNLILLGEAGEENHTQEQIWLDFAGRWGDYGNITDELRGKRGPCGPLYRENGMMWNEPVAWGNSLDSADSNTFMADWLFYNFIFLFLLITLLSVSVSLLIIRRAHRKSGLGKRIFSILYIDGINLKTMGNILTIIGMLLAVLALFYPWYSVSLDIKAGSYSTDGMVEVVSIDGLDGVQINKLEENSGMVQIFAFPIPFSVVVALAIFKIVLSSAGIRKSSGLGKKYIRGGIKLMIPVIIILLFVAQLGAVIEGVAVDVPQESEILIETISDSPLGGSQKKDIGDYGSVDIEWGLQTGGYFLLASGILLIFGGILEIASKQEFFSSETKKDKDVEKLRTRVEEMESKLSEDIGEERADDGEGRESG